MMTQLFRRDFLQLGTLAPLGLGLGHFGDGRAQPVEKPAAKRCILVWLDGGPSHLDTFDPKPLAPSEVRGPLETISTSVSGIELSELLPLMAARMDAWTIIRSMTSPLGEHNFGAHYLLTGYRPTPALEYPSLGSVVAYHQQMQQAETDSDLPPHIAIPNHRVGGAGFTGNGFLPAETSPFSVGGDPANRDFHVRDLQLYPNLTIDRVLRRRSFLEHLDQQQRSLDATASTVESRPNNSYRDAYQMILSETAREAFDLDQESAQTRQAYGSRTIGQSCLLARRLVERGVPFVTVNNIGWDTHNNAYTRLRDGYNGARTPVGLVPNLDRALAALIDDLSESGLIEETLVLVMGEFGRTPKLNTLGGRDHWPRAFSVALAGGGLAGGRIIGASDRTGEGPADNPVTPSDLAYAVYQILGIDPRLELTTPDGRPIQANRDGSEIAGLLS